MQQMLQLSRGLYRIPLFMLLSLAVYSSNAQASDKQGAADIKISLTGTDIPLKNVFKAIQKQSGLFVMYSNSQTQIDREQKVSVSFKQARLDDVLSTLFGPRHLGWRYSDKTIVLYARPEEVTETKKNGSDSSITTLSVSGKVTDAKGAPIPGATVQVKGSNVGAITDGQGLFSLSKVKFKDVLMITSLGYQTREVTATGASLLIQLGVDVNDLGETVVVGYGTTTKRFNTGNVTTVKGEDIGKQPVSNPLAALQGRVPGMVIIQNTGVPGSSFKVLIRGRSSLNSAVTNDPLYIIDGMPYPSQMLSNLNDIGKGGSPLNFINPSDIESITVLKDADATAIYGSRGANGVVLITTKKGKNEKGNIDFDLKTGFGTIGKRFRWMGREEYLGMRREAFKNDNVVPDRFNAPDLTVWDTTRYTDWQKELIGGNSNYLQGTASFSGGNQMIQYLIGATHRRETTVFPGNGSDKKSSVHINLSNSSYSNKFKFSFSAMYMADDNNLPLIDFTYLVPFLSPVAPPIYGSDGKLNWENSTWSNPIANLGVKYKGETGNLVSNASLSYLILPELSIKANFGYSSMNVNEITPYPTTVYDPAYNVLSGSSSFGNSGVKSYIVEPQIEYKKTVGKGILNVLVGSSYQKNTNDARIINASGFTSDALLENIQAATALSVVNSTNFQYKYSSIFGRINYNLKERYLLNFTARRDGSSRFGPENQFATFGALGLAWIFSEESLVKKNLSFLSFGKLRASYGSTGNDQIPNYGYLDLFSPISFALPYQGSSGLVPQNLFNSKYGWEISKKLEGGIEIGFFKDAILFSINYFQNRTSNQLVGFPVPAITGFTTIPYYNLPALVKNYGWEVTMNSTNVKSQRLTWNTSFNLTIPKNKLVKYPGIEGSPYSNDYIVGQPITIIKTYNITGVDSKSGLFTFSDSKGNIVSRPNPSTDRTNIINPTQSFYGGFSSNLRIGGFELDLLFQFVKQIGHKYIVNYMPGYYYLGGYNQPESALDRWQNSGDVKMYPKYSQSNYSIGSTYQNYANLSNMAYGDASFIRLKNISISWICAKRIGKLSPITNLKLYLLAQNLFTITGYKGLDPETQNMTTLPPLRQIVAGIQVSL